MPAAALASEKIIALGLREMGKLRLFEAAYSEAATFSRRSLDFEDVADAHVDLAAANLFTNRLDEALKEISQALAATYFHHNNPGVADQVTLNEIEFLEFYY